MASEDRVSTAASDIEPNGSIPQLIPAMSIPTGASPPATTLASLARRISSRTSDLLAIAIVVVASLTLGRQVLEWWHAEPPAAMDLGPMENVGTEWGSHAQPVLLNFGDSPVSLTRQVFLDSSSQTALEAVRQRCQEALIKSGSPHTSIDAAERDQLLELSKLTPDMEQPGDWGLYTLGSGLATVVGVKNFPAAAGKTDRTSPPESQRVLCWGLVFPGVDRDSWIAWTFVRRTDPVSSRPGVSPDNFDLNQVSLPAGSYRTVVMQETGQGGLLGFQGEDVDNGWQRHFTQWFEGHGWKPAGGGKSPGAGWTGRFARREPGNESDSTIDVQFHPQAKGPVAGLIHWMPGRPALPPATQLPSRGAP